MNPHENLRHRLLNDLPASERQLDLAGISTAVLEGGEGPPVVLLHGPGAHAGVWVRVFPELTRTNRVVAPDLPGHGESSAGDGPLDREQVLAWLDELIEATCEAPPALVGHHVGGPIAVHYTVDSPERVERLLLVVSFGLAAFEPAPEFHAALTGYFADPNAATHDELWRHCVADLDGLRQHLGPAWEPLRAYNVERLRAPGGGQALSALMSEFGFPAIPDEILSRVSVPTSLLWGDHDVVVPLSVARAASETYGWPLEVLEAGDEPALEAPDAFLRAFGAAMRASRHSTATKNAQAAR